MAVSYLCTREGHYVTFHFDNIVFYLWNSCSLMRRMFCDIFHISYNVRWRKLRLQGYNGFTELWAKVWSLIIPTKQQRAAQISPRPPSRVLLSAHASHTHTRMTGCIQHASHTNTHTTSLQEAVTLLDARIWLMKADKQHSSISFEDANKQYFLPVFNVFGAKTRKQQWNVSLLHSSSKHRYCWCWGQVFRNIWPISIKMH